jgi:GT2 family glycosyltransferase
VGTLPAARPRVHGKFLFVGEEKLYVRGVTYGVFRPDASGNEYGDVESIQADLAQIAENGFNAVRTHTMPPVELLDLAHRHGLWVMVGLSCEDYAGYLADGYDSAGIERQVRAKVSGCAGHPALLCYALGNEIPGSVARWLGAKRIERYLERLCNAVKQEDQDAIVTYVNYPTTEYLRLDFLDLLAFNVYLEDTERFSAYLARLHHLAGDRPLLMSELGLDSLRNGQDAQARFLRTQVETAFEAGCAGTFIFSWTDEWHRGGEDVHDWAFGVTDRRRQPKPALRAVREACVGVPFPVNRRYPRVSVVVCAYNAETTIADTLDGLMDLAYPNYEVIVVDDGSTDATGSIASEYDVALITTPNRGLSNARNTGLWRSSGRIVAYIDADARPDPHWLDYLSASFEDSKYVAVGGPNIASPGDGDVAECISNAPGNPTHVMLSDRVAEHIPGCNMAFRREALIAVGGFDPRFRVAGDDVDICWRMRDSGGTIGFSPSAVVWHHRRNSIRAFWRQQVGYGAAEGQLEAKWPERHNNAGQMAWSGRIYGSGQFRSPRRRALIYRGPWGTAPFQSIYEREPGDVWVLAAAGQWRLLVGGLLALAAIGAAWTPLLAAAPLALAAGAVMLIQASIGAAHGSYSRRRRRLRLLTTALYVLQPLARLRGRVHGQPRFQLSDVPWTLRGLPLLRKRRCAHRSEVWREPAAWLADMLEELRGAGAIVCAGRDYEDWDLHVRGGRLGGARLLTAFEDVGYGKQYLRFLGWPKPSKLASIAALLCATVAASGGVAGIPIIPPVFAGVATLLVAATAAECSAAVARLWAVVPTNPRAR